MKRFQDTLRCMAVLACLLCWMHTGGLVFAKGEESGASTAVDLVILIDDSRSMFVTNTGKPGNDPNQYRREAAAIMLNMCELVSSRAAVVSFGGRTQDIVPPGHDYDKGLISISGDRIKSRQSLIATVLKPFNLLDNTNVAAALKRAEELFACTPAQAGNQRVVLLITDDWPFVSLNGNKDSAICKKDGIALLDKFMETSAVFSSTNPDHAHIYVVKLRNASLLETTSRDVYKSIAELTGGNVYTAYQAADLPACFASMLADQIGSQLSTLEAESHQNADGSYGIDIRIPNQSVTEANILMNMDGVLPDSVRLFKPVAKGQAVGQQAVADEKSVFASATKSFVQYKIANAEDNGIWELTYALDAEGDAQKPKASVMVLFSYNLSLTANLAVASEKNPITAMEKTDTLALTMHFADSQGQPSTDRYLYQPTTTVNGQKCGITVSAYALPKGKKADAAVPATALTLTPSAQGQMQFALTCKPADLGVTGAGDYLLYMHAEGDGLVRDLPAPIAFTVVNNPPQFRVQDGITLRINDPAVSGMAPQASMALAPGDAALCHDSDGAFDTLTLSAVSADEEIVWVEEGAGGGATLVGAKAGQCELTLIISDGEANGTVRKTLPVTVVDVQRELRARYRPQIRITAPVIAGKEYPIGDTLLLELSLPDGGAEGPVAVDGYALSATLAVAEEGGASEPIPLTRVKGQNVWQGSMPSGNRNRAVSFTADIQVGLAENNVHLLTQAPLTARIGNVAPVPVAERIDGLCFDYWVDPSWLDTRQPDEAYLIDLTECFADDDAAADLTYYAAILPQDAPLPTTFEQVKALSASQEEVAGLTRAPGGQLTVQPRAKGDVRLVAGVSDSEDQWAIFARPVAVHSIREAAEQRAWHIAIAAVAAALLALLVITLLKPGYRGLVFDTFQRGVYQDTKRLPSGKRRQSMMFARPIAGGAEGSLLSQALSAIYIKPGIRQSLLVTLRRQSPSGLGIELDNKTLLPHRRVRMTKNSMLTLRVRQNGIESVYSWKLTENRPTFHTKNARGGAPAAANGEKRIKRPY